MKNKISIRAFRITIMILICLNIAFFGMSRAYENIRLVAFGEYKKAVEISNNEIRIFDFTVKY